MEPTLDRPTTSGSVLAVAGGTVAVALLIGGAGQWLALFCQLSGLAAAAGGYAALNRGRRGLGWTTVAAGTLLIGAALSIGLTRPPALTDRLEVVPGLLGLAALVAGLVPVRPGRERAFVSVGAGLLFLAVVTSGVIRGADRPSLLLAGVATVFAWDLGEHAVSLGRQIGRGSRTYRAELVHAAGTLAAGLTTALLVSTMARLEVTGLSLTQLVLLLVAGFVLVLAARR